MSKRHRLASKHNDNVTENEVNYLTNFEVKTINFNGVSKIHKPKEIPDNLKGNNSVM